jgi:hypothetical protein
MMLMMIFTLQLVKLKLFAFVNILSNGILTP